MAELARATYNYGLSATAYALENSTATDQKDLTVEETTVEEENFSTDESTESESEKNEEESEEETQNEGGVRLPKDEF